MKDNSDKKKVADWMFHRGFRGSVSFNFFKIMTKEIVADSLICVKSL